MKENKLPKVSFSDIIMILRALWEIKKLIKVLKKNNKNKKK